MKKMINSFGIASGSVLRFRTRPHFDGNEVAQLRSPITADLEMVRAAYCNAAQVAEVPVDESEREVGGTHFPALSTGRQLLRYLLVNGR